MIKIDRERVRNTFRAYTNCYDVSDEKIRLKINHTYRVASICGQIAASEGLSENDTELAWLLGMLHDVGRFEQLRRFHTFIDAKSVNHAELGADILFCGAPMAADTGRIRDYAEDESEDELIETAVRVHSAYRIPEKKDERILMFCNILRDADKVDILRVNIETPPEEIYDTTTEELYHAEVSPEVMEAFYRHGAVLRELRKTTVDNLVGHISLVYELVYPKSFELALKQGYLEKLLHFPSQNRRTVEQFEAIRTEMERYRKSNPYGGAVL